MKKTTKTTAEPPSRKPGILLVDDAAVVRSVFAELLHREGFQVWVAAAAEQAVDLYRRHGGEIDLVVLDKRMPQVDGIHTLAALHALNPNKWMTELKKKNIE